jgi:DNA recombination protein RmuC
VTDFLPISTVVLLVAVVALLLILLRRSQTSAVVLASRLDALDKTQERIERAVREEAALSRDELAKAAREQRQELTGAFRTFGHAVVQRLMDVAGVQKNQLESFSGQLGSFAKASGERLDGVRAESATGAKQLREEVIATLKTLSETITQTMGELAGVQKTRLEAMSSALGKLSESNEKKLEAVRGTVESKLQGLQIENARQLEQMRQTVDEKLQGTLEKRLGESFQQVSERLEQVHKGLGEMQALATGVGDLIPICIHRSSVVGYGDSQRGGRHGYRGGREKRSARRFDWPSKASEELPRLEATGGNLATRKTCDERTRNSGGAEL